MFYFYVTIFKFLDFLLRPQELLMAMWFEFCAGWGWLEQVPQAKQSKTNCGKYSIFDMFTHKNTLWSIL